MNNSYSIFYDLREASGEITLEEKWWKIIETAKISINKKLVVYCTVEGESYRTKKAYEIDVFLIFLLTVMKTIYFTDKQLFLKMKLFSEELLDVVSERCEQLAFENHYKNYKKGILEIKNNVKRIHA